MTSALLLMLEIDFSGYEKFMSFLPLLLLTAFSCFSCLLLLQQLMRSTFRLLVLSFILGLAATGASAIADLSFSLEAS